MEAINNNAAMREALKEIERKCNSLDEECAVDPVEIRDIARAALSSPPRNCARPECKGNDMKTMRESVGEILWCLNWLEENTSDKVLKEHLSKPISIAQTALAIPQRNCDVGSDDEQYNRMRNFCLQYTFCEQCPLRELKPDHDICGMRCGFKWGQMTFLEQSEAAGKGKGMVG